MQKFVFGYGSLMNPKSLQRTLPGATAVPAQLFDFQRKFNIPVDGYLYLNIVPKSGKVMEGVCIPVSDEELAKLKSRERGYECVDVSEKISGVEGVAYAFIAPDKGFPGLKILQSYIDTCLAGVSDEKQNQWIEETIIENEIENDRENPKYANIPK